MVKLAYSILYVNDVEATIGFYEKAFGLQRKFVTPDNTYGELLTGEVTLSFASLAFAKSNMKEGFVENSLQNKPFAQEIGFTTENVEEVFQHALKSGAVAVLSPEWKDHGQTVAYVRDPDGFLIEICTPMQ